jgi:chemotaxis protein methyltransferase CheR
MAFTYFFRDLHTLNLVRDIALPELKGRRYLDIWDAGCAMGPEPFSLAIVLREAMSHFMFRNVRIFATDVDGSNLFGKAIEEAVYPFEQIQRIPDNLRATYFQRLAPDKDEYRLREDIRGSVQFTRHNLLTLQPIRSDFAVVVCKNVLLHFSPQERSAVVKMFHDVLSSGGFIVTEATQELPDEAGHLFESVVPGARIYRKIDRRSSRNAETPG